MMYILTQILQEYLVIGKDMMFPKEVMPRKKCLDVNVEE